MEYKLILERVVTLAQQSECIKTQQSTIRGELSQESIIEVMRGNRIDFQHPPFQGEKLCGRCGIATEHSAQPEMPFATSAEKLDTSSLHVRISAFARSSVRMIETENSNFLGTIHSSDV